MFRLCEELRDAVPDIASRRQKYKKLTKWHVVFEKGLNEFYFDRLGNLIIHPEVPKHKFSKTAEIFPRFLIKSQNIEKLQ